MKARKPAGRKPKLHPSTPIPSGFNALIGVFELAIASPPTEDRAWRLSEATMNVWHFLEVLMEDPMSTQRLVNIARAIRSITGEGRDMTEQKLMEYLGELARLCRQQIEDDGFAQPRAGFGSIGQIPPESRRCFEVLQCLCHYALDCLAYNKPHDSAIGRRRSIAFEILAEAVRVVDLPEVVALARKSLAKANSPTVYGALMFLQAYYVRDGWSLDDEVIEELEALSERTHARTIASSALNVLIEARVITDMDALGRMDEWKEKRWGR